MIYKNTSIKRVIAKVFTDLNLQEGDHRVTDMIEWAGEALEKIGAFPSFINKVSGKGDLPLLVVSNYQTKLPGDFHRLIQVNFSESQSGPFYPMRYATGSFDYDAELTDVTSTNAVYPESTIVNLAMDLYKESYEDALSRINTDPSVRGTLNGILNQMNRDSNQAQGYIDTTSDYTYLIKPGYIKTNVPRGYIMLAYQAVPTDSEGFPLIPDDVSFIEAVYWYIVMKLYYPMWVQGSIRDGIYFDARNSWNFYCKQAYGNAMMPNVDQMESIKNTWLRLIPEINEHATSYSTLGQRQKIYNAN